MSTPFWTISNALSTLRIVLIVPITLLLYNRDPHDLYLLAGLVIAAVLTDLLDGWLARRLHEVTEVGKILDPLADKISIAAVGAILSLQGRIPVWFFVIALTRDVLIFGGGMYIKYTSGLLPQAHAAGKWAVTAVTAFLCFVMMDQPQLSWIHRSLLFVSTGMLALSFTFYLIRFIKIVVHKQVQTS